MMVQTLLSRSSLPVFLLVALFGVCEGQTNPSEHWARCRSILKEDFGLQTRECTAQPRIPCLAKKYSEQNLGETLQECDGSDRNDCPTAPDCLGVTTYKEWAITQHNKEKYNFYGANVSWTLNKTGTDKDYGRKYFEVRVEDGGNQTFIAKIEVNLTEDDYINDQAVISYDCFYPFFHKPVMATAIIKTIPHKRGDFLALSFSTGELRNKVFCRTVPSTATMSTTSTTTTSTTTTSTTTVEAPAESTTMEVVPPAGSDDSLLAKPILKENNSGLLYGLVIGVAMIAALAVIGFLVNRYWGPSQNKFCRTSDQRRDANPTNNCQPGTSGPRRVMVVYNDDEMGHRTMCQDLSNNLAEHFSCEVTEPSGMEVESSQM